jgi:replicative DNA helicase
MTSAGGPARASDNRQQIVSDMSRSLKLMAKELKVPVICLSQLSRANEARAASQRRPMLSDLRESGSIEQDADAIMFLYNDAIYNKETANPNKIELIIAKNRHGPTETVYLSWNNTLTKFGDYKPKKENLPGGIPLPDEAPPV